MRDNDGGNGNPRKVLEKVLIAAAEEHQSAGLPLADEMCRTQHLIVVLIDEIDDERVRCGREERLQLLDHRGEHLIVSAFHHNEDGVALLLLERLCAGVQLKAMFRRDGEDGAPRPFADVRLVVEHARDGAERVAGQAHEILDRHVPRRLFRRHPLTAPAATPLMIYFWQKR